MSEILVRFASGLTVVFICMGMPAAVAGVEPGRLVDETFEHFSAGRLGGGGFNIYAARRLLTSYFM